MILIYLAINSENACCHSAQNTIYSHGQSENRGIKIREYVMSHSFCTDVQLGLSP
jgi:hypothetical protein